MRKGHFCLGDVIFLGEFGAVGSGNANVLVL